MKRTAILFAALAGLFLAAQAQAQAPKKGYYLGAAYNSVWTDAGGVYNDTVNEDTSPGGKIYGGYMWSDNWGMELGLQSLGKYESFFNGAKISELKTNAVSVSSVYTQPLFDWGYNVNVRFGLAFTEAKYACVSLCGTGTTPGLLNVSTKNRGVSGTFGIGVSAKLTESLGMRVDYDHIGNVHHKVDLTEYRDGYDTFGVSLQLLF